MTMAFPHIPTCSLARVLQWNISELLEVGWRFFCLVGLFLLLLSGSGAVTSPTLYEVQLTALEPGPTWIMVKWGPDLTKEKAEGQLSLILSYSWTSSGFRNTMHHVAAGRESRPGWFPTRHNISNLHVDTWYTVCVNATHFYTATSADGLRYRFEKKRLTCDATRTTPNEVLPPYPVPSPIVDSGVDQEIGATWAQITVTVRDTPYEVIAWQLFLDSEREKNHPPESHAYNSHHTMVRDGRKAAEKHVFGFDQLRRSTLYYLTLKAYYQVPVRNNQLTHLYENNFGLATLQNRAIRTFEPSGFAAILAYLIFCFSQI